MTAELSIYLLNAVILFVAYTFVYPKIAGQNINQIALLDVLSSALAVFIVANKYWGSGIELGFLSMRINWFWFTLISYTVLEVPVAIWYLKKLF